MQSVDNFLKGFCYGTGFSIAVALITSVYLSYIYASSEATYRKNLAEIYQSESFDVSKAISPKIIKYQVDGSKLVILSSVSNSSVGHLGYYLKFRVTDKKGSIGLCRQDIEPEYGRGGEATFQTICAPFGVDVSSIQRVEVSLGRGSG
ncbi:hypothetical protein [Gallaecimonas sp. GXIMD1310]|uniref:hypothetical protein n=1 Tax=Gallaecimonas sp. GXIMD1310 TaxID=3131926 RepID=UPI00324B7A36